MDFLESFRLWQGESISYGQILTKFSRGIGFGTRKTKLTAVLEFALPLTEVRTVLSAILVAVKTIMFACPLFHNF